MLINCPICAEVMLVTDTLFSTPSGHIFHENCLKIWLQNNQSCPQCRQACTMSTIHRIYLPNVSPSDPDALVERLNDINRQKVETEQKLKVMEIEQKKLESQLKKSKKDFHKFVHRSKRVGRFNIHLPRGNSGTINIYTNRNNDTQPRVVKTSHLPKQKRNANRIKRAKEYFKRKRQEYRNNNNNQEPPEPEVNNSDESDASISSDDEIVIGSSD